MSIPAFLCRATTSSTARHTRSSIAVTSTGIPSSRAHIIAIRSSGRGRLPTCVVRKRPLVAMRREITRLTTDRAYVRLSPFIRDLSPARRHFGVHMTITRLWTGAVVAAAALSLHLSAQQTPAPVERGKPSTVPGPVPRTADGRPDLHGIWLGGG